MDSLDKSNLLAHMASLIIEQDKIALKSMHIARCLEEAVRRLKEEFKMKHA